MMGVAKSNYSIIIMSSQRQRKRNSQFRRKRFDQKYPDGKIRTQQDPTDEKGQCLEPEISLLPKSNKTQLDQTSYVMPDQEHYDLLQDARIEQVLLEEKLAQLLSSHLPPSPLLQPIPTEDSNQEQDISLPVPSIDLLDLAKSLATIPLHRKLFIERDLVELCEGGNRSEKSMTHPPEEYRHKTEPATDTSFKFSLLAKQPPCHVVHRTASLRDGNTTLTELSDLLERDVDRKAPGNTTSSNEIPSESISSFNEHTRELNTMKLDTVLDELLDM